MFSLWLGLQFPPGQRERKHRVYLVYLLGAATNTQSWSPRGVCNRICDSIIKVSLYQEFEPWISLHTTEQAFGIFFKHTVYITHLHRSAKPLCVNISSKALQYHLPRCLSEIQCYFLNQKPLSNIVVGHHDRIIWWFVSQQSLSVICFLSHLCFPIYFQLWQSHPYEHICIVICIT